MTVTVCLLSMCVKYVDGRSFLPQNLSPLSIKKTYLKPMTQLYPTQDIELTKSIGEKKTIPVVPLSRSEVPKFLSLSSMMFWIVFIFTLARDTKDTLVVTSCGAESISFLKVFIQL